MGLFDGTSHKDYYQGSNLGNYQFISLDDIITQFQIAYVGEGKIIPKIKNKIQQFLFFLLVMIKLSHLFNIKKFLISY